MNSKQDSVVHAEWNSALELVVKREAEEAEALHWLHHHASRWAGVRTDVLTVPSIILATVTGFLSGADAMPSLYTGIMTLVVGILNTLNSYFRFSQRSEGHKIISVLYLKVFKNIQTELALPISQRTPASALLSDLREKMARISETAPPLPEASIGAFKQKFKHPLIAVPIIANGLDPVSIYSSAPMETPTIPVVTITVDEKPDKKPKLENKTWK
jgi:hypothetical protein